MPTNIAIITLPLLCVLDYLALVYWLMRTAGRSDRAMRFSLRSLLIAMTIAAFHLGLIAAFLSAR